MAQVSETLATLVVAQVGVPGSWLLPCVGYGRLWESEPLADASWCSLSLSAVSFILVKHIFVTYSKAKLKPEYIYS